MVSFHASPHSIHNINLQDRKRAWKRSRSGSFSLLSSPLLSVGFPYLYRLYNSFSKKEYQASKEHIDCSGRKNAKPEMGGEPSRTYKYCKHNFELFKLTLQCNAHSEKKNVPISKDKSVP